MPIGLVDSLEDDIRLKKAGFTIQVDWLCQQAQPLAHPHYNQKMVSSVIYGSLRSSLLCIQCVDV
jgi:hypothetical protein